MPILDFNSLYPNLMLSYKLDPALIVLDDRFATCLGVKYNRVVFSDKSSFLFAVSKDGVPFPGIMIQHTQNLIKARKAAQAEEEKYSLLVETCRFHYANTLNETHDFIESVYKGYTEVEALKDSAHTLKEEVLDSLLLTCCILKSKVKFWKKSINN